MALLAEDLDSLGANFAADALIITRAGVRQGRQGIRRTFVQLFVNLPHARWDRKVTYSSSDVVLVERSAESDVSRAGGVDLFVFGEGLIQVHMVLHTLTPNP
jgi:hypothetical protein